MTLATNPLRAASRTRDVPPVGDVVVERPIGDTLVTELERAGRDPLDSLAMTEEKHKPKLVTPSMVALIQSVRPSIALTDSDRDARRLHKALGNPMATWKDGQIVWVQPEDIQVDDEGWEPVSPD